MLAMTDVKPSLLKISDKPSVRFQKIGSGPPLLLIRTIRTQLEYFRAAGTCSGWKIASQASSAKSKVFKAGSERRRLDRRMTVSIDCNRERRRSRDTSFPTVSQSIFKVI
jgi:hypothetical protein